MTGNSIPTGDTIEVVIDRLRRAGNFADNAAYCAAREIDTEQVETVEAYMSAARWMLDEAQAALDGVKTAAAL